MVEGIVFWLVPVILLIVLIFLSLQIGHHHRWPKLYIIEPLDLLVKSWRAVRFEPDGQALKKSFKLLSSINLSQGTLLEKMIVAAAGAIRLQSKSSTAILTDHHLIGPLAEQFIISLGSKKQSILIGPLEQIEGLVADEKLTRYRQLSQKSAENGYLSLLIATSYLHGDRVKTIKHQIEGLVILEPIIDQKQLSSLQKINPESVRFLTVLPSVVAGRLYDQTLPSQTYFSLNSKELETLLPPKFAEAEIGRAKVVGGADLVARHQALRVWQQQFDCVVVSRNSEDHDLPVTPITRLPN